MWQSLMRLFSRQKGGAMQGAQNPAGAARAVADAADELQRARARLNTLEGEWQELSTRIVQGDAGAEDFTRRQTLLSELTAARDAAAALESRQTRAAQLERSTDLRVRLDETMSEIGELVPRLELACVDLRALVQEIYVTGLPPGGSDNIAEVLGVPADFGDRMLRALAEAAPGVEWDYPLPGERPRRPNLRVDRRVVQVGRAELPPGASGVVNSFTGEVIVGAPTE
jgi:hypothetical protein